MKPVSRQKMDLMMADLTQSLQNIKMTATAITIQFWVMDQLLNSAG